MESIHRSNPLLAKPYHIQDYNKVKSIYGMKPIGNLNPFTVKFNLAPDSYGNKKITYSGKNSNCKNCNPDTILLSYLNMINNQTIDEITRAYGNTYIPFSVYPFYLSKNAPGYTFTTSGRIDLSPSDKAEFQLILEKKLPNQHGVILHITTRSYDPEDGLIPKEITGKDEFTAWMTYATSIETLDYRALE